MTVASRIMLVLSKRPATFRMIAHEVPASEPDLACALYDLRTAGKVESTECDGVSVYHIPTPISKP